MIRTILIKSIRAYQKLSGAAREQGFPLFAHTACRQWPTCSEFAIDALWRYGVLRGACMAIGRVARCNPLTKVTA